MHWCIDETLALLSVLPFVGMFIRTYKAKIHGWFHRAKGTTPVALKKECPHEEHDK